MSDSAKARLEGDTVLLSIYSAWSGEAFMDEDAARMLRDQLSDCLSALHARAMHERAR